MSTAPWVSRQNLLGRGLAVDFRVGWVVELLGHIIAGVLGNQLFRGADGAGHAFPDRSEQHLGPQGLEHPLPFDTHAFRHGDDELVAASGADQGQADAHIPAGGLDDHRPWRKQSGPLRRVQHRRRDAVFHAPQRVHALHFRQHGRPAPLGHASQPDQRGVADALRDILADRGGPAVLMGFLGGMPGAKTGLQTCPESKSRNA